MADGEEEVAEASVGDLEASEEEEVVVASAAEAVASAVAEASEVEGEVLEITGILPEAVVEDAAGSPEGEARENGCEGP